jgi:hypothetical protein
MCVVHFHEFLLMRQIKNNLTVKFNSGGVSIATFKSEAVEGPGTAAFPVAANSFEGEPVWVVTAALLVGGAAAVLLGGAGGGLVEAVGVLHGLVDTATADENVQKVSDKAALNGASPSSAVGARVDLSAFFSDGETGAADSGSVSDFPWDAGGTFVFGVSHSAFVTVVEDFAHLVDGILRLTFTSAVVVTEVAPAAVFVHLADSFTN